VSDQRVGAAFRAVRVKRRWRQRDVALRAGVSVSLVSLIERGHLDRVSLSVLRRAAAALDIRIDVLARWRGGELDRLLSARHSALQGLVAGLMRDVGGWDVLPEVSFSIWGERGAIDLLCWHAESATVLVIEIKTEIVDAGELLSVLDRKARLAPEIAAERGWRARRVARWVVVADGPTNRRHVSRSAVLLRAALPVDGRRVRPWLRGPAGSVVPMAALSFLSDSTPERGKRSLAPTRRVRRPAQEPPPR
jgi:transcriptional regulator with XRE-family HTH domain